MGALFASGVGQLPVASFDGMATFVEVERNIADKERLQGLQDPFLCVFFSIFRRHDSGYSTVPRGRFSDSATD
jgi:hypothetical protein